MHIEQPFKPFGIDASARTTKAELSYNIDRWAGIAQKEMPPDVGFIMIIFPKGSGSGEANYIAANLPQEQVKERLKGAASSLASTIHLPPGVGRG
jgi:hypothetical protein